MTVRLFDSVVKVGYVPGVMIGKKGSGVGVGKTMPPESVGAG